MAANETPCETSKFSATLQCSWGLPSRLGRSDLQDENTSGDMRSFTPWPGQESRVQGHSIKGGLLSHLKSQSQLTRLHLNRSTSHQRAVLAMLSEAFEGLCIPASKRERKLKSVHAANRAAETQWNVHVRVSSILSRSCSRQEAASFASFGRCIKMLMVPCSVLCGTRTRKLSAIA